MSDTKLVGIVCSLRTGAVHHAAARAATELTSESVTFDIHDVSEVPLFNSDLTGPPVAVGALFAAVAAADGIVLFSPEYNSSLPAVTKNLIDWLSVEPAHWDGTGITMVTLSPGPRAGTSAREHFEAILPRQATRLFPTLGIGVYGERLDDAGELTDADTLTELRNFLDGFASFCLTSPE